MRVNDVCQMREEQGKSAYAPPPGSVWKREMRTPPAAECIEKEYSCSNCTLLIISMTIMFVTPSIGHRNTVVRNRIPKTLRFHLTQMGRLIAGSHENYDPNLIN